MEATPLSLTKKKWNRNYQRQSKVSQLANLKRKERFHLSQRWIQCEQHSQRESSSKPLSLR